MASGDTGRPSECITCITHTHTHTGPVHVARPGPTRRRGDPPRSPRPHTHLQVVGRDHRPPPWTPDVLLHLPQGLEAAPAAAPVLVQVLQQHPLGLQEAQLPVIMPTGQQGESKRLEEEENREREKEDAGRRRQKWRTISAASTGLGASPGAGEHPLWTQREPRGPPLARGQLMAEAAFASSGRGSPMGTCTRITWGLVKTQRAGSAHPASFWRSEGAQEPACLTGPQVLLPVGSPLENRGSGETCFLWEAGWQPRCPVGGCEGRVWPGGPARSPVP